MNLSEITIMVLSFNEEENISRTLTQLQWAKEVMLIDSFSTDSTLDIASQFSNVRVEQRTFDSFAAQCNYGLSIVKTPFVLSIDADYLVTEKLFREIERLNPESADGYLIPFRYCVEGVPLSGTILPPRICLYRKDAAHYENDGHAHRVKINGKIGQLKHAIWHDDRKPISRWLNAQDGYMKSEVEKLFSGKMLSWPDRIRKKIFFAPVLIFFFCLILKKGILDGKRGWYYAYQRMLAECLLSLRIIEYYFGKKQD